MTRYCTFCGKELDAQADTEVCTACTVNSPGEAKRLGTPAAGCLVAIVIAIAVSMYLERFFACFETGCN